MIGAMDPRSRAPLPIAPRLVSGWALAVGLGILSGCAGLGAQAERIDTELVKLDARSLRSCLGDAPYYEIREDGSEVWAYTSALTPVGQDIQITRSVGPGTAFQRPRVESGDPIERRTPDSAADEAAQSVKPGQCVHLFTVREGAVIRHQTRGRSYTNMNADAECTLALSRCVPEPSSESPAP